MNKEFAIASLGGTIAAAAEKVGTTYRAVHKWPDVLPPRIADRVQAALWRELQAAKRKPAKTAPVTTEVVNG